MAKNIEIVKPMIIEIGGNTYTLEFNRNSVVSAERAGLVVDEVQTSPMTMIPLLFYAAFKMHHPKITREETDNILFNELGGLSGDEFKRLAELYAAPTSALFRKDDDGERKNAKISL